MFIMDRFFIINNELAGTAKSTPGLDMQREKYLSKLEAYERHKKEKE